MSGTAATSQAPHSGRTRLRWSGTVMNHAIQEAASTEEKIK
jgi:hypothetical protein